MSLASSFRILSETDGPAVEVVNASGRGAVVLVCEHASAFVPAALAGLGLAEADRLSHAAWDPGALAVARVMSEVLDAPLVASCVSRLVYDCNRPPEAESAMPATSELVEVPGNRQLTAEARAARTAEVYVPFHETLAGVLDRRPGTALVTVHSFSPTWYGAPRRSEIGLLHDADDRLARAMMAEAHALPHAAALNVPYSAADGVTHTLAEHGTARGLPGLMIEIRNDLIADAPAQRIAGQGLALALTRALKGVA